ncbi:MAG: glycosyltransferase family 4 protein [Mycobacterium sp.]|nr:glycosyltransferase family 4 protein [Mycobacterium sp.]
MVPRLLVLQKHFTNGHGGVPETTLALARLLASAEVAVDVLAETGLVRDVGELMALPDLADHTDAVRWPDYQALIVVGGWVPRALPACIQARRYRERVIYAPRGALARTEFKRPRDLRKLPYLAAIELPMIQRADRVLFSSQLEADSSLIPARLKRRSVVLPDPFFASATPPMARTAVRVKRYGFIAEISPGKGLLELAKAFKIALQRVPPDSAELHIAGVPRPGSERYLEHVRRELEVVEHKVIWHGSVRGPEREAFYRAVDCLIAPSRMESYGLTPLEALARGVPAIVSPHFGVIEHIPRSEAVRILPSRAPLDIADALSDHDWLISAANIAPRYTVDALAPLRGAELARRYRKLLVG